MNDPICKNCSHYHQHYALDKRKIFRVFCGHCTLGRARHRKPYAPACEHFLYAPPDEFAFANKEYLSKELLQYLLNLPLLPNIYDTDDSE